MGNLTTLCDDSGARFSGTEEERLATEFIQDKKDTVGEASVSTDVKQLHQTIELYRGDFLVGFYVLNAPDFES